ncbi:hypothetical protein ACOSQ3_014190 [Xanthoceras sorbifolium]
MEVSLLLRHNTSSIASSSTTGMSLATEERWSLLTLLLSLKTQGSDSPPDDSPTNRNLNVKDNLSIFGENIGCQLRVVAAFLAPPPNTGQEAQPPPSPSLEIWRFLEMEPS